MTKHTPIFKNSDSSYVFECKEIKVDFIDYRIGEKKNIIITMTYKDSNGVEKVKHLVVDQYNYNMQGNMITFNPPVWIDFSDSIGITVMELSSVEMFDVAVCFESE